MRFKIKSCLNGKVIFRAKEDSFKQALELTIKSNISLQDADLRNADLRNANLQYANLQDADLRNTDLRNVNLQYANLWNANLQDADLRNADLRNVYLQEADLRNADLRNADLRNANLDFSCWPLSCKSLDVKVGDRLVAQLFFHWARLDVSQCSPHIRYMHRFIISLFGKSMANWFCKFRADINKI